MLHEFYSNALENILVYDLWSSILAGTMLLRIYTVVWQWCHYVYFETNIQKPTAKFLFKYL